MRRLMLFVVGLLLMVTAVYLSFYLAGRRDLLILASISPAIVAAFVMGIIFLLRVFERRPDDSHPSAEPDDRE